jgi:hypothetical protein
MFNYISIEIMRNKIIIHYLTSMLEGSKLVECPYTLAKLDFIGGKTFQNLSVSSPAPVIMLSPFGLILKNSTL